MKHPPTPEGLTHYTQLEDEGVSWRRRAERVRDGALIRVHHGWYADAATWASSYTEGRHLRRVLAVARSMRSDHGVFSHESAAVLWGLPLYRHEPVRVQTTLRPGVQVRSTPTVYRHRDRVSSDDIVVRGDIAHTGLARTVIDIARVASSETAIAAADAAFRLIAWDAGTRTYDDAAAAEFRDELDRRLVAMVGRRGIRHARWIVEHADGRAQLPGESVSRMLLLSLGFTALRLQVPVAGPRGHDYFVDFGLDDVPAWGEFDGRGKYVDPELTAGRDPLRVLTEEKEREDWIRATTGRGVARWGSEHIGSSASLARRLAVYGIRPPQ